MEIEFEYTVDPSSDRPIMLLNKVIGGFDGIDGGEFQRELMYLDTMGKECIEIMINSPGGSVLEGLSIASAILACKTPIITNNVGIAGSMAGVIFMCAKTRIMADYALLMMHLVQGGSDKARPMLDETISMLLSKNASLSKDQVKKLMDVESWLNYDECMKNNFCTGSNEEQFTQNQHSVVFNENAYNEIFDYANNILNNINMKKEKSEIKVEEQELELVQTQNEEVSVDTTNESNIDDAENKDNPFAICTASVGREDKAKYEACVMAEKKKLGYHNDTTEEEFTNQTEIENVSEPVIDYKNLVDEKDILIKQLEAEINRMKTAEQEKEINNFINQHVELGKISEDTKDSWANLCRNDFESTKEVIKSLNINKEAPKLENNISGEKKPQSFIEMMNFGKKNK